MNDYGIELLSPESKPLEICTDRWSSIVENDNIDQDLEQALNLSELVRRQFRVTARISGLTFEGYPGRQKSLRMLQTSAGLLYDVLYQYDPEHVLLRQAKDDVLRDEFDVERLSETLRVLEGQPIRVKQISQPSPLALPLVIDRLSSRLSTETIATRLERFTRSFDAAS